MKLKYYLRGLGLGIVLTSIIMGVVLGNSGNKMSDEEIKRRAKQLGMVEAESTLSSYSETAKIPEGTDENDNPASDKEMDKEGKEIFEKIDQGEPSAGESVPEVAEETEERGTAGESSESIESEEDVKLAADDSNKVATTDVVEAQSEENSETSIATDSTTTDTTQIINKTSGSDTANSEISAKQESVNEDSQNTNSSNIGETQKQAAATDSLQTEATQQENVTGIPDADEAKQQTSVEGNSSSEDVNYIVVVLPSGSESDDCARILREAGVIEDGVEFNKYLVSTGKDRSIRSGTKQIPKGLSFEEIAAIITK